MKKNIDACNAYFRMNRMVKNAGYKFCDEWKNKESFIEWYAKNKIKNIDDSVYFSCDFLKNDKKIFSPDTCCFIPKTLFMALRDNFGEKKELPQGISYIPSQVVGKSGKYKVTFSCKKLNVAGSVGVCDSLEEAIKIYKEIKEQCIHILADSYKEIISENLYFALKKYEYESE